MPDAHRRFAHRLIDLGAVNLVHGHSSHHPLPIEVYRERLVLYGCGDLINDYEGIGAHGEMRSDVGCLYFATLDSASWALQRLEIVPLQLRRFRLQRADAAAKEALLKSLDGGDFGTRIDAPPAGGWTLRWGPRD